MQTHPLEPCLKNAQLKICAQEGKSCPEGMTKSEAIRKLKSDNSYIEPIGTSKCETALLRCKYDCAEDKSSLLDDCSRRCEIKNDYCKQN